LNHRLKRPDREALVSNAARGNINISKAGEFYHEPMFPRHSTDRE
jgi:hypothetical protein